MCRSEDVAFLAKKYFFFSWRIDFSRALRREELQIVRFDTNLEEYKIILSAIFWILSSAIQLEVDGDEPQACSAYVTMVLYRFGIF